MGSALVTGLEILVLGAGALSLFEVVLAWRQRRGRDGGTARPFGTRPRGRASASRPDGSTATPRVSILKPLSGLEDGLFENLASFAALEGVAYEVVASVADPGDPAVAVFERVRLAFPDAPFRLVTGGGGARSGRAPANPKVERLVAAAAVATGDVLLISDANVRVAPADVAATLRAFDDATVGCVSNLFVGAGARTLGARLEALHLLTFVAPGNVLAAWAGVPCVVGKSMAIRREVLDRIGGFEAFRGVLAEDQRIGLAVRDAGFAVRLSPVVVRNVVARRAVSQALARQVRWGKMRRCFSPALFLGEVLMMPVPLAAALVAATAAFQPERLPAALALAAAVTGLRVAHAAALGALLGARLERLDLALVPVQALLQLASQVPPLLSREVDWRGHRLRLGPGTQLLPPRRAVAAV